VSDVSFRILRFFVRPGIERPLQHALAAFFNKRKLGRSGAVTNVLWYASAMIAELFLASASQPEATSRESVRNHQLPKGDIRFVASLGR
jgi:hypothetical protein